MTIQAQLEHIQRCVVYLLYVRPCFVSACISNMNSYQLAQMSGLLHERIRHASHAVRKTCRRKFRRAIVTHTPEIVIDTKSTRIQFQFCDAVNKLCNSKTAEGQYVKNKR